MVATTQIEAKLAFEPPKTPGDVTSGSGGTVARESTKPDLLSSASSTAPQSQVSGGDEAVSVEISAEAQRVAANDPGNAASNETHRGAPQDLDATIETSATAQTGTPADASFDGNDRTNQVTSFENERTGNDTRNNTEAGRTLGQVIDTFA